MTKTNSTPPKWLVVAAFAIVYTVWGSTYLGIRFAIETLPPFLMAGVRFLLAGGLLYAIVRIRNRERIARRNWYAAGVVGLLMLVGGPGLVTWAEQLVPSGLTALMIATVPMWMVTLDWAFFRGPRPSLPVVLGLLVGLAGVAMLIGPTELSDHRVHPVGGGVLVAACLFWSIGSLHSRRASLPRSPFLSVSMQMLAAGSALVLIAAATGEWSRVDLAHVSAKSLISVAYLIVFGSIVALTAYTWLLRVCRPAQVATYAYVNPIVAVVLGHWFADEPLTSRTVLAAALIVAGVLLVTMCRKPATKRVSATAQAPTTTPPTSSAALGAACRPARK